MVGHAYNHDVLMAAQSERSTQALGVALRVLEERRRLLLEMARVQRRCDRAISAKQYELRAAEVERAARAVRDLLDGVPAFVPSDVEPT
jgi:hypothetical protein